MAEGNITVTTAANFIPELWSPLTKDEVESNLVMARLILRDYEGEIKQKGDTVRINEISNLTANDKEASTDVSYETITEDQLTLSIDKHKYAAFKLEDIVAIQANVSLMQKYTGKIGYALAKQVDTDLLALYVALSQMVGTDGTAISTANFLLAIQHLDVADAPETERYGVFHSSDKTGFLAEDDFVRYDSTGIGGQLSPIIRGRFGEIFGVQIFFSTNVTTTGSPSGNHNLVFHREAFALAMQRDIRVQAQYDIDALADKVVGDVLYGVREFRDEFGVVYKT